MMYPEVLFHVPHASVEIPDGYRGDFSCDLAEELACMTDRYTDELFELGYARLVFPVSRLVCDPERFRDDARESMARLGMGAVYTRGHDLRPIRRVSPERREEILRAFYDPHHRRFAAEVRRRLDGYGRCLIVDCHSFPAAPLPYEPDPSPLRPDVCIGTDPFHTPGPLADRLEAAFCSLGYATARDRPYAGAIVPLEFYEKDPRVLSVMIEINRGLYMGANGEKSERFQALRRDIGTALEGALRS